MRFSWLITCALLSVACGGGAAVADLERSLLVEGRGVEPDLLIGITTLAQARATLGPLATEPSTTGSETVLEAAPLRLVFFPPDSGGEPLLQAVRAARIPNPSMPSWEGRTAAGVAFLDTEERVRQVYGQPADEWHRSFGGRALYYPQGVVVVVEHPSAISGYTGPPPEPTSASVTELWVTAPFAVLDPGRRVGDQQRVISTPPRTTLRFTPY